MHHSLTVLIVDDNAAVRRLIATVVAPIVRAIHECADGAAAIDACTKFRPDVVLMDLAMPVVDGIEATRAIHANDPAVRVLIVTDHDGRSTASRRRCRGRRLRRQGQPARSPSPAHPELREVLR